MTPALSMTKTECGRPGRRMAAMLALVILVAGCAALQPAPVPGPDSHLLQATAAIKAAPAKRDLVLEVSAPRAWPGFDTPQMAYVQKPYQLDYFANSRWAEAPARMLGPLLAQALERTGGFRAVVQTPSAVPADLRVAGELVRLQQDFTTRPSRVELTLRIELLDVRARRVLATRVFDETETAPSDDAYGGVIAANAALQRVLAQAAEFCITGASGLGPVPAAAAPASAR
jgi:cholesterol transport system auxiliary component